MNVIHYNLHTWSYLSITVYRHRYDSGSGIRLNDGTDIKLRFAGVTGDVFFNVSRIIIQIRNKELFRRYFLCSEFYYGRCSPRLNSNDPLLFLVYINDTVSNIGSNIRLFEDEITVKLV